MSAGKGSKPRPMSIPYDKYVNNYDEIFRKKKYKGIVVCDPNSKIKVTCNEK